MVSIPERDSPPQSRVHTAKPTCEHTALALWLQAAQGGHQALVAEPGQEPQAKGPGTPTSSPQQGAGLAQGPCWRSRPGWDLWVPLGHVKDHIKCNKCRSRS